MSLVLCVCTLGASYGQQRRQIRDEKKQGSSNCLGLWSWLHASTGGRGRRCRGLDILPMLFCKRLLRNVNTTYRKI